MGYIVSNKLSQQWLTNKKNKITYIMLLRFLNKEGLSVIPQLHVQLHWFSIDLNVNLQRERTGQASIYGGTLGPYVSSMTRNADLGSVLPMDRGALLLQEA